MTMIMSIQYDFKRTRKGSFGHKLTALQREGWEVVSCSAFGVYTLRRPKSVKDATSLSNRIKHSILG